MGVLGKILGIGHGGLGQTPGQIVADKDDLVHDAIEPTLGQLQVAVVGEDHRPAGQASQQAQQTGLELGEMDADDIVLADEPPGQKGKGGHDDALAHAEQHRRADHAHAVDHLLGRQGRVVARGQHRDLVAPLGQGCRQAFDIDGQGR